MAKLFIGFGDYFYGIRIPDQMAGTFDDLASMVFDENTIYCKYHGKGHEGEEHRVQMWTEIDFAMEGDGY